MTNVPSALETPLKYPPVLLFTALMDTFGTAAPDESATKPVSEPVMMPWAWEVVG